MKMFQNGGTKTHVIKVNFKFLTFSFFASLLFKMQFITTGRNRVSTTVSYFSK